MKYLIASSIFLSGMIANAAAWICANEDGTASVSYDLYTYAGKNPVRFIHNVIADKTPILNGNMTWESSYKGGPIPVGENATLDFENEVAFLNVDDSEYVMGCSPKTVN